MIQNSLNYHVAHLWKIGINFQMFLNNYRYFLLNYILALQHKDLSNYLLLLFISLIQSTNGAQYLNITYSLFQSACLAAAAPAQTTGTLPLPSI